MAGAAGAAPGGPPIPDGEGPAVVRPPGGGGGARTPRPDAKESKSPAGPAVETRLEISVEAEGVSLFAVAADAHELFTLLGEKAGLRIVIDDTVNRKITVRLSRRKPKEVIDNIVAAYGLASAEVNGVVMISEGIPKNPSSYLLSDIDSIRTRYVLASTAKSLLPVFLQDHVKVNYEQNAVVLSAPTEVLKKFRADVAQFDIPAAQIAFDVIMVELTRSGAREWAAQVLDQARRHARVVDPATGTVSLRTIIGRLPLDFNVRLRALVERGEARVHANPRIVTVSGRRATIFIGKQRYIATPVDSPRGQINFIDAGVNLEMTPYTGGEGEIITELKTEVSTMSAPDPTTRLPEKSTRQAQTVVRVRDSETIILGGLVQRERMESHNKLPLLGDVPLIGGLFRSSRSSSVETELVIFVTPRILSQTGHLPAEEEAAIRKRMRLDEPAPGQAPQVPAPGP